MGDGLTQSPARNFPLTLLLWAIYENWRGFLFKDLFVNWLIPTRLLDPNLPPPPERSPTGRTQEQRRTVTDNLTKARAALAAAREKSRKRILSAVRVEWLDAPAIRTRLQLSARYTSVLLQELRESGRIRYTVQRNRFYYTALSNQQEFN